MAWISYDAERDATEQAMLRQLQAIAKIKAKGIQDWLASYRADAETLSNDPDLIAAVETWQRDHNAAVYQHLSEMLEANNRVHSNAYRSTTILTWSGERIVSKPDQSSLVMKQAHDWRSARSGPDRPHRNPASIAQYTTRQYRGRPVPGLYRLAGTCIAIFRGGLTGRYLDSVTWFEPPTRRTTHDAGYL